MNLEIKAVRGADKRIALRLPHYCEAADVTMTVTLTTGATVTPTLTSVSEDTYTVTAVGADRRTLTLDAGTPSLAGLVGGDGGAAFWFDSQLGEIPIRIVERSSATTVVLADPLPGVSATGTFCYGTIYALLTNASGVTSATQRLLFTVVYTYDQPGGLLAMQGSVAGVLHVVPYPFSTGLTTDTLVDFAPHVRSQMPVQIGSYQRAIEASERVLWRWIRQDLKSQPAGRRTEDSVSGSAFLEVHALLCLAHIATSNELAGGRGGQSEALTERARTLYENVMKSIPWLDSDGDGIADEAEQDAAATGASAVVSGAFNNTSIIESTTVATPYARRFFAGQSH